MDSIQPEPISPLRLPPSLLNVPHRLVAGEGVQVYSADLPSCLWRRERFELMAIAVMGEIGHGLARWLTPTGKKLCDLILGDVWIIPPGMETTCEFASRTDLLMIFLAPRHLARTPPSQARQLAENCTVAPLDGYAKLNPMLHDLHYVLRQQAHGQPYAQNPKHTIDHFKCATAFARDLWLLHYVGLRATLDKMSPAQVIQELG